MLNVTFFSDHKILYLQVLMIPAWVTLPISTAMQHIGVLTEGRRVIANLSYQFDDYLFILLSSPFFSDYKNRRRKDYKNSFAEISSKVRTDRFLTKCERKPLLVFIVCVIAVIAS